MSELPAPVPRRPIHARRIAFEGFLREDGLWDIDCELCDTKSEPLPRGSLPAVPPGEPVHLLRVRLTIDEEFRIHGVQTGVAAAPFPECQEPAEAPMQKLVGLKMGPGWRKALEGAIGGLGGCTHLRELVFNAATVAFQMILPHQAIRDGLASDVPGPGAPPAFYMGKCMSWSFDGAVMQRLAPHFYRPSQPLRKTG